MVYIRLHRLVDAEDPAQCVFPHKNDMNELRGIRSGFEVGFDFTAGILEEVHQLDFVTDELKRLLVPLGLRCFGNHSHHFLQGEVVGIQGLDREVAEEFVKPTDGGMLLEHHRENG